MAESVEGLERRIDELRAAVRRSVMAGDRARAKALRTELRQAERAWDDALAALAEEADGSDEPLDDGPGEPRAEDAENGEDAFNAAAQWTPPRPAGPLLPIREQVHQALTLLSVPAAPKLIAEVHRAFAGTNDLASTKLTHLRRDEERSFRVAPYSRPYYLCSALTADHLAPARGLLAVSTWPLERRIVGPLSPRFDFLTAAIKVAEQSLRMPGDNQDVSRLVWRFAVNIPGAAEAYQLMGPGAVVDAARAELRVHADADWAHREAAAKRARAQLNDVERLFGSRLRVVEGSA